MPSAPTLIAHPFARLEHCRLPVLLRADHLPRSARSFGMTRLRPPPNTPASMWNGYARSSGPGLPGRCRHEHDHRRPRGRLGAAARMHPTNHGQLPTQHDPAVRTLRARDRPGARNPATRGARDAAAAPGALPVLTRRPGPDPGSGPTAAPATAGSDLPDTVRSAGSLRVAGRRGAG